MTNATAVQEETAETPALPRRGRGKKIVLALGLLAVAGGATTAALGLGGEPAETPASTLPPSTTEVKKETLKDTTTEDGELGYGQPVPVGGRLRGTITWLPDVDDKITRGERLYQVDGDPVTLMYGSRPAYRDLKDGVEGLDVKQLERNLRELGYTGFTVDDEFTASTAEAVEEWQDDRGLEETGVVEFGRVVFVPEAIRVDSVEGTAGAATGQGKDVLHYTETDKAVTVELDAADRRLAKKDTTVEVTLPNDETVKGRIDELATEVKPASGDEDPETVVEVVVAIENQKAAKDFAMAAVDVEFTADQRKDVLAVPVSALLALREGGFGVEVVENGTSRYVPVETGLFSEGRVEISGDRIEEGTTVGVAE